MSLGIQKLAVSLSGWNPDFYLPETDVIIEVKPRGMDRNDRMQIASALLKGEDVKLEILTPTIYKILEKVYRTKIQEWES